MIYYLLAAGLLAVGMYAVLVKRNLIKIVMGMLIIEYAVNLMLILVAYRTGGQAPIVTEQMRVSPGPFVDPLPQALILTSIVIGLALVALMVTLCLRLYQRYGTLDTSHIRRLKG